LEGLFSCWLDSLDTRCLQSSVLRQQFVLWVQGCPYMSFWEGLRSIARKTFKGAKFENRGTETVSLTRWVRHKNAMLIL